MQAVVSLELNYQKSSSHFELTNDKPPPIPAYNPDPSPSAPISSTYSYVTTPLQV